MEQRSVLGSELKSLRRQKKLSQIEVAKQLDVIRQTYSHYETGRIMPTVKSILLLSRLYEVPVEYLMELYIEEEKRTKA